MFLGLYYFRMVWHPYLYSVVMDGVIFGEIPDLVMV
jgi:hypothetical protein